MFNTTDFQQYFSYIVAVSFTGGENWSTRRKRHWQTLSHNVVSSSHLHEQNSNSQLKLWLGLIAQVVVNPTTIWSRIRRPPKNKIIYLLTIIDMICNSAMWTLDIYDKTQINIAPPIQYVKHTPNAVPIKVPSSCKMNKMVISKHDKSSEIHI